MKLVSLDSSLAVEIAYIVLLVVALLSLNLLSSLLTKGFFLGIIFKVFFIAGTWIKSSRLRSNKACSS
jgi:hypothetical protein